jgi:hypothetical protein
MESLNRAYTQIVKHYTLADNVEELFDELQLSLSHKTGKIIHKRGSW